MRWFFDTEFVDRGCGIDLISIGMISEEGKTYSACLSHGWNEEDCDEWLAENVLPHLPPHSQWKSRKQVSDELISLCGPRPEFWGYFSAYDWVALSHLISRGGRLLDLPKGWPHFCFDLKQLMDTFGFAKKNLPSQEEKTKHEALADAAWVRSGFLHIREHLRTGCCPKGIL